LAVAIGGGAGVEVEAGVVGLLLEEAFVFFEGLVVVAGLVFAQGAGGGGEQRGRGEEEPGKTPRNTRKTRKGPERSGCNFRVFRGLSSIPG